MTPPRWTAFASFSSRRALWGLDHVRHRAHDGRAWLGRGRADRLCIVAAHDELVARGIDVSEIWHGPPFPAEARQPGADPERTSYGSFCAFTDPDGNTWLVQEVTMWLPGRTDAAETSFASMADLPVRLFAPRPRMASTRSARTRRAGSTAPNTDYRTRPRR